MSDIFREVDEDLRRDQLAGLWKRYGSVIMAGVVLLVAGTGAWVAWDRWRISRQETATTLLTDAMDKAQGEEGKPTPPAEIVAAFADAAGKLEGGPANLAQLFEAAALVRDGQTDKAVALYDKVAGTAADTHLRELATLLAVQAQLDGGDPAQLQGRLAPLAAATSPWRWSAQEMLGLLAVRAGDRARARDLFAALAAAPEAPAGLRSRATELAALYAAQK